jgi:hypothetical protein
MKQGTAKIIKMGPFIDALKLENKQAAYER